LVEGLERNQINVALVGVHLKDEKGSGLRAVQRMRTLRPQIRSVVLVESAQPHLAIEAFRAGAKGVFRRSEADIDLLSKCVARVHAGQIWASSAELEQLVEAFRGSAPVKITDAKGVELLSTQEAKIVRLVADGRTNREIASHLELSAHTVKNYLFKIYEKLGISNRVELVLYAMSQADQSNAAAVGMPTSKRAS
jgi:DNA-binding NarL/FixJ family response regulator